MTIRKKMIMLFIITFVVLISVVFYSTQTIFIQGFIDLEIIDMKEKISRAANVVNYDITSLEDLVVDWAEWDDTYQFVVDHNQEYIERNMGNSTFNNENIHLLLIVDSAGNIIYGKAFDNENNQEVPLSEGIKEHIFPHSPLLALNQGENYSKGIILLPQGPLLLVAKPIVDSTSQEPARGLVVMGRYLNQTELAKLSNILQLPLSAYSAYDENLPEDFRAVKANLQQEQSSIVIPLNENIITGYGMLPDIYGNPAVLFKINRERNIFQHGNNVIVYYLSALVLSGLIIGMVLFLLLEKRVLVRLATLNKAITEIGTKGNISYRVNLDGNDELTNVADAINRMLDRVEQAQRELEKSEFRNRAIVEAIPDLMLKINKSGQILDYVISKNHLLSIELSPSCIGQCVETILPKTLLDKVFLNGKFVECNGKIVECQKNVNEKNAFYEARFVSLEENKILIIVRDITERKEMEDKLKYYSYHDSLTGLYNRAFFNEQMLMLAQKPSAKAGIIMCDIDGLKFVNDTLGHDKGDTLLINAANILKQCCSQQAIIARMGGDEFVILVQENSQKAMQEILNKINNRVEEYNLNNDNPLLKLSFSLGVASNFNEDIEFVELIKQADNKMYREKLHCRRSVRSSVVQTLKKTLEFRDFITEGHAERLAGLMQQFAIACNLPQNRIHELELFAEFHDIGKIGIPDQILFKEGPLTPEERLVMQQHSDIGYRIAQASPDLEPISEWILKHHEWWGGQGYPLGIKGESIPMECRILAILDAYDAMTNDRPYRKALRKEEAIQELQKQAGIQFDPNLVAIFVKIVE